MLHDEDAVSLGDMGTPTGPINEGRTDPLSVDEKVDETERDASPASDPPSFWAGPDRLPVDPDESGITNGPPDP